MRLRVEIDGEALLLDLSGSSFTLHGDTEQSGTASIEQVAPGVFSVLLSNRSFQVHIAPHPQGSEVWVGLDKHIIALFDPRDRSSDVPANKTNGPIELRVQMPGKIIKMLAELGATVTAGQGLIVVEAMKMQNEVKAPKTGTLKSIHVTEGTTVSAGDLLLVVE